MEQNISSLMRYFAPTHSCGLLMGQPIMQTEKDRQNDTNTPGN
jgi:hypothetical protein